MPQPAGPQQLFQEERLVRDRAVKTHAGCSEREIQDFSMSSICHNCILAPKVQHTDTHTHTHSKMQNRFVNWSSACLPTLQFPYSSSNARSIKRFCSLRYCWRSQCLWASFSIFSCKWSLFWNTFLLAAWRCFCCLSCSSESCVSTACRDCILLLRKFYIKKKKMTLAIVQPALSLNFIHSHHWNKPEIA